jgi:4a-hydroxytetrahydrobiopterin dehydratase
MDMMTHMSGVDLMSTLSNKKCVPCQGGVPSLSETEIMQLMPELNQSWKVIDNHHLKRSFGFPDFSSALSFVNQVGEICEEQGHHADFELGWGRVVVLIWTHKIDGLVESDFILASKIDEIGV